MWRSVPDKAGQKPPFIIVECKSDNVTIRREDYAQGDHYARLTNAPFFVTHNHTETRFWRVRKDRMPGYLEEIEDIPHADATNKQIDELLARLKTFKEDEFADLLHQCHNVIRNREKKDPVAAFDETAKILFVKVFVERELKRRQRRKNLFTVAFLEDQLADDPLEDLFQKTKAHYQADRIFAEDERLNLKPATGLEIVRLLERYNLSDTSEDIKGIAFERFLGRTFRGEIGQFFTPRPIVEFMVRMVNPQEGDVICDPASGSGGFLIRFFEIVRQQILADVDRRYQAFRREIGGATGPIRGRTRAAALRSKYEEIPNKRWTKDVHGSRMWNLANRLHLRHGRQRPHGPHQQDEHDHARRRARRGASPRRLSERQRHLRRPLRHHPDQPALWRQRRARRTRFLKNRSPSPPTMNAPMPTATAPHTATR